MTFHDFISQRAPEWWWRPIAVNGFHGYRAILGIKPHSKGASTIVEDRLPYLRALRLLVNKSVTTGCTWGNLLPA